MNSNLLFSKRKIYFIGLIVLSVSLLFTIFQYKSQINDNKNIFLKKVNNEIKKSLHKKVFEIEGTIKSLSNFYQASNSFSSLNFNTISSNLIKYYPSIENIIYAQLVNKVEVKEFYNDINNMGMVNYKIYPNSKDNKYLPILYISPNSFKYTKYLGYDLFHNNDLTYILKKSSINANVSYYEKEILSEKINTFNIVKASYFGTITPIDKKERKEQTSGYFIISINLDVILKELKDEFPSYIFSLTNNKIIEEDNILNIFETKIFFANSKNVSIYISKSIYLNNINIYKIIINNLFLLIIQLMIIVIIYKYKENLIEKDTHLKKLEKSEKLASMGEMLDNIAHQWRQPLSIISTIATGMQLQKESNILNDEKFYDSCKVINKNAQYLSKTIDDFSNFIKGDKEKKDFSLNEGITTFLHLIEGTIKSNNIKLILDLEEEVIINGYENELMQCLINIFNNSKDALIENNIKNKYIFITTYSIKKKVVISIKDNAGGIPVNIINKIFEPYFTTKHKSQGTGLGLHMVYSLIVEDMNGTIDVKNIKYKYNHKSHKGVLFKIVI